LNGIKTYLEAKTLTDLWNGFYKGKNVLITGHTGFKGSWLAIWLTHLGANVIGYSLEPHTPQDNFVLSDLEHKITHYIGDIRNSETLQAVFESHKPDIVFHLAAQPIVRYSYTNPVLTYETNVLGTLNVLEAIRHTPQTKTGIIITTDKCYKNKEWIYGYRENDELGGFDPYSSSKACAEILVSSYRDSYFNTNEFEKHGKIIASVRAGNVIGGGDWADDRIIPDCIRAIIANKPIVLRSPFSIRPWQHVLEPLYGYLTLAQRAYAHGKLYSGAWNFGPNNNGVTTVEDLVTTLIEAYGSGEIDIQNTNKLHEAAILLLNSDKSNKLLGWRPKWSVPETVEKTVEWYKSYQFEDVYHLCTEQIEEYCNSQLQ
jgi:CDP-glucose 4,6-dehydratase